MRTAAEYYCDFFDLTLGDLDKGDRRIIKAMEGFSDEKLREQSTEIFIAVGNFCKAINDQIQIDKK